MAAVSTSPSRGSGQPDEMESNGCRGASGYESAKVPSQGWIKMGLGILANKLRPGP